MSMRHRTETIAIASGKGGTGKTLFTACLGNALLRSQLRVLLVDADPATSGLTLFMLGTEGWKQLATYSDENTFAGFLRGANLKPPVVTRINRLGQDDHRVSYPAVVSSRGAYGDEPLGRSAVPNVDRDAFTR